MDTDTIKTTLYEATQESIECLAFAEIEPVEKYIEFETEHLQVTLEIISPEQGIFTLKASNEFFEYIAHSLMPSEEEISETQIKDLALELLNTIGGNFLNKILSDNTTFSLGLPVLKNISSPEKVSEDSLQCSFMLEEFPFSLYLAGEIIHSL